MLSETTDGYQRTFEGTETRLMKNANHNTTLETIKEMFLPSGYPTSVSPDYTQYQICDTLQAFCSSITGLLATRASFQQAGVGDIGATATAATVTRAMQDVSGMVGRILFTYGFSTVLDTEIKTWRFMADILNDTGLVIEMLSALAPRHISWAVVCVSSLMRVLCGVAAGSTKAALSQHFALKGNVGDLNAKDGSQETLVGLVGMLVGTLCVQMLHESSFALVWLIFSFFTLMHLLFNYYGVRSIVMHNLNEQRVYILISEYLKTQSVLTPLQVSQRESVFWRRRIIPGASLTELLTHQECTKASLSYAALQRLRIGSKPYLIRIFNPTILIALHESIECDKTEQILEPCFYALCLDYFGSSSEALEFVSKHYKGFIAQLRDNQWNLDDGTCKLYMRQWRFEWNESHKKTK